MLISSIWKDEFFTNFEYPVFIISFVNPNTCAYDKYLSHSTISSGYLSAKFPKSFRKALKEYNFWYSLIPLVVFCNVLFKTLLYEELIAFKYNSIIKVKS